MAYDYEYFKKEVYTLTKIDLNAYKEKQMKRRIDTLIAKNKIVGYDKFVQKLREDKAVFDEFVNYLTINVSEFYRNPEQWKLLDQEIIPELISKFGKEPENMECCMLYRRRAIFSGYGVIQTYTIKSDKDHSNGY